MASVQVKTHSCDAAKSPTNAAGSSEELKYLLPKLRNFQQEAFLFATQGKVSKRMKSSQKDDSSFSYDRSLLGKGRILLADEMGLGKTVTSLAIMAHYKEEWPLLILCPASLRHTWPAEIEKFLPTILPNRICVLDGFNDVDFVKRKDIQVVVATYSLLQTRSAVAQLLISKQVQFKCVIADESHNLKAKDSQKSKIALPILQAAQRLLLLSGTPAVARPVELWLPLHALAPKLIGSYKEYTKTYCDAKFKFGRMDVTGLSNAKELHHKLRQVMVRRLKCDVLHELPAKQRTVVPINISNKSLIKENQQLMKQLRETRMSIAELVGDDQRSANFEAKSMFMQAYQESGIAKAQAVADYLVDWIAGAGTQKVLVFAHHKAVMDVLELALSKELKGVGHIRIDGSVPANDRAKLVRKFQTSAQVRVGLLSMTAAGVGLTLTAASNVMFAELHFTPGVLCQAEDRAHRIGQRNAVNIMYFVCKDSSISVDSQIWSMLGRKIGTLEQVIEGGSGKERAALAATEVEEYNDGSAQRRSGQEELTAFFAENGAGPGVKKGQIQPKIAVKGSILSFFKKAADTPPVTNHQMPRNTSNDHTPTGQVTKNKSAENICRWSCRRCTFMNSKQRTAYLACDMCNGLYDEDNDIDHAAAPVVTPKLRLEQTRIARKASVATRENEASPSQSLNAQSPGPASKQPPPCQIVVIDDSESSSPSITGASKRKKSVVIDLDGEEKEEAKTYKKPRFQLATSTPPKELLMFSVSKNSGRITIHYKEQMASSSFVNFDVLDILTHETVDRLAEVQTKRSYTASSAVALSFQKDAIQAVVERLDRSVIDSRKNRKQACDEIQSFVTSFMSLREIQRKAIKSAGESFSSKGLAQAAAKVMTQAFEQNNSAGPSTERYGGGAKERAEERLKAGTATREDMALLKGERCSWCAGVLSRASRQAEAVYCSQKCAEDGRLLRGGMFASNHIRDQAFALEAGVCTCCGIDAHALFLRVKAVPPAQRLSVLCNVNWKLPKTSQALEKLLQDPKEGSFWQVDHIKAVAEGGGSCGMQNLRTLCVPCHILETAKLRRRLKLAGGKGNRDEIGTVDEQQTDIRTLFGGFSQEKATGLD